MTDTWTKQGHRIDPGDVPDLFGPFRQLVDTILPHLAWIKVDDTNKDNITCLFRPADDTDHPGFDIDQLSSGEKAALALLLPFVEEQVDLLVNPAPVSSDVVPVTMLLDEPEIHLHPLLQLQVLQYLRELTDAGAAQFILTTQSPTLLDALTDDELYLLSPAALRPDNQLSRLTTSHERLEVARDLTGATHMLTRAKPVVFVEGEPARPGGVTSDARLVQLLLPATRAWALVPGRSRNDVVAAVQRLRLDGVDLPGAPVFGLVDADRATATGDEHVIAWPVAMIENLLLDPDAVYEVLKPFGSSTPARNPDTIRSLLSDIAEERVDDEIRLRIKQRLPIGRLEIEPHELANGADLDGLVSAKSAAWAARLRELGLDDANNVTHQARDDVEAIRTAGTQLERFHGKRMLQKLHQRLNVSGVGLSQAAFATQIANAAAGGARLRRLTDTAIAAITLYIPSTLASTVTAAGGDPGASALAAQCDRHRAAWERGEPDPVGRAELRRDVFALARTLEPGRRADLTALAAEIGTS